MYALYETATGRLLSSTADAANVPATLPAGTAVKQVATPPSGYVWDAAVLDFVAPPKPTIITRLAFLQRLTAQERIAIRASTDTTVSDWVHILDATAVVDLAHQTTKDGINYLVSVGLLTSARGAQVLTP